MNTLRTFTTGNGKSGQYHSLPALAEQGFPGISRMPVSLRIVLESLLRNCDGLKVTEQDVKNLAGWSAKAPGSYEIPFTVARIILQDLTGVPLLVDLAAMRAAVQDLGKNPADMEPLVPVAQELTRHKSMRESFIGTFRAPFRKRIECAIMMKAAQEV